MFTSEDFKISSTKELLELLPIIPFIGFIAPVLLAFYTLGFVLKLTGRLD